MKISRSVAALAATGALLVSSGCSGGSNPGDDGGADDAMDQVTYLTGFGTFGREAYAYVALDKGYFEEEGIEVDIQAGQGTGANLGLVASGQVEFGQGDLTGALQIYGTEQSQDFTIVSAIQQRTLAGIMSLEKTGIESPSDLEGKTIGDADGSVVRELFGTYATLADIDPEKVEFVSAPPPELPTLLAEEKVHAIGQFAVGKPLIEAVAQQPSSILLYSDYLTDLYGIALATSKELAEENPDLVRRFNTALFRGVEYTMENPQEAAEIMASYIEDANPQVLQGEIELLVPYLRPSDPGAPLGSVDDQRVARSIAILEGAGTIPPGLTPQDVISFELTPQS